MKGKRQALLRLLAAKFGPLPEDSVATIDAAAGSELDAYIDRVLTANSLEEMGLRR